MKKYLFLFPVLGMLVLPVSAFAEESKSHYGKRVEKWRGLTHEEKKIALEERRANWNALSGEEKAAKRAEHKASRAARRAKADEKYGTLNDDQKVKFDAKRERIKAKKQTTRQNWNKKRRASYN